MEVAKSNLVIVGANTNECKVYWNGVVIEGLKGLTVNNDEDTTKVIMTLAETPQVSELKSAGIIVRREA